MMGQFEFKLFKFMSHGLYSESEVYESSKVKKCYFTRSCLQRQAGPV